MTNHPERKTRKTRKTKRVKSQRNQAKARSSKSQRKAKNLQVTMQLHRRKRMILMWSKHFLMIKSSQVEIDVTLLIRAPSSQR